MRHCLEIGRREDLLEFFLGHLAELSALLLCRIASGFGWLILGFLVVVIHGSAPFLDTEGFVVPTVERSHLGFPGGHEREGSLDRLNPHYMEAEATYMAARPVVAVPAWRASAERPSILARAEGRTEQAPAVFIRARGQSGTVVGLVGVLAERPCVGLPGNGRPLHPWQGEGAR